MAKADDNAPDTAVTDADLLVDPVPSVEEVKSKDEERKEARASDDPNDDIDVSRPDVGREVSVDTDYTIDEEPPAPEPVKVELNPDFKVPELEEYTDEQGRPRGRVKGYVKPEGDVRVYVASAEAGSDYADDDGYVTLPASVPPHVATSLAGHPAVKVVTD